MRPHRQTDRQAYTLIAITGTYYAWTAADLADLVLEATHEILHPRHEVMDLKLSGMRLNSTTDGTSSSRKNQNGHKQRSSYTPRLTSCRKPLALLVDIMRKMLSTICLHEADIIESRATAITNDRLQVSFCVDDIRQKSRRRSGLPRRSLCRRAFEQPGRDMWFDLAETRRTGPSSAQQRTSQLRLPGPRRVLPLMENTCEECVRSASCPSFGHTSQYTRRGGTAQRTPHRWWLVTVAWRSHEKDRQTSNFIRPFTHGRHYIGQLL